MRNFAIITAILFLSGCATTIAPNELDDLRRQINVMEGRVQEKNQQIEAKKKEIEIE